MKITNSVLFFFFFFLHFFCCVLIDGAVSKQSNLIPLFTFGTFFPSLFFDSMTDKQPDHINIRINPNMIAAVVAKHCG